MADNKSVLSKNIPLLRHIASLAKHKLAFVKLLFRTNPNYHPPSFTPLQRRCYCHHYEANAAGADRRDSNNFEHAYFLTATGYHD